METKQIIAELDAEISRLQQVKALLSGTAARHTPGRPSSTLNTGAPKKRVLSAEARAKIAAAQKIRWAKVRKAAK